MDNPLVSVIVPCYMQSEYLPETLDCLISQTYHNWEAIVIDDGSPDNVGEVVKDYAKNDSRFKFVHTVNQGVSAARNTAIRDYSDGEYILPLDGDDLIMPEYLDHAVGYMQSHPDCKLVYGLAEKFGAINEHWKMAEYEFRKMLFENLIFNPSMFRRCDFDKTIGYNVNMIEGVEDWDFWITLLGPDGKVHRLDELVYRYRIKEFSRNVEAIKEDKIQRLRRQIYDNHKEYYAEYVRDIITYVHRCNSLKLYIDKLEKSPTMKVGRIFTMPARMVRGVIRIINNLNKA